MNSFTRTNFQNRNILVKTGKKWKVKIIVKVKKASKWKRPKGPKGEATWIVVVKCSSVGITCWWMWEWCLSWGCGHLSSRLMLLLLEPGCLHVGSCGSMVLSGHHSSCSSGHLISCRRGRRRCCCLPPRSEWQGGVGQGSGVIRSMGWGRGPMTPRPRQVVGSPWRWGLGKTRVSSVWMEGRRRWRRVCPASTAGMVETGAASKTDLRRQQTWQVTWEKR